MDLPTHTLHPPVLVVDRDTAHTDVLRSAMRSARMVNPVFEATTPTKALGYLRGTRAYADRLAHPLPVVVVISFGLDDPGGRQVLEAVRSSQLTRHTPVLVIGSTSEDAEVLEAHALGATAYLARSLASRVIVDVIRSLSVPWCIVPQMAEQ